jgi:hypothetical protein
MYTSTYKLAPICDVLDCELCEHASLIYEKVYHQLHVPLEKPFQTILNVPRNETKRTTIEQPSVIVKDVPPPRNEPPSVIVTDIVPDNFQTSNFAITDNSPIADVFPAINCVFTRDKGKLYAHDVRQNVRSNNLNPNNPKQGLFADCISKKPRLEPKPTIVSSASGNFVVAEKQESARFKFTPYQLRYNQQNDAKKKRRFKELREHGQADGYYCFHKMLPQPTEPCCGQCFRIGL